MTSTALIHPSRAALAPPQRRCLQQPCRAEQQQAGSGAAPTSRRTALLLLPAAAAAVAAAASVPRPAAATEEVALDTAAEAVGPALDVATWPMVVDRTFSFSYPKVAAGPEEGVQGSGEGQQRRRQSTRQSAAVVGPCPEPSGLWDPLPLQGMKEILDLTFAAPPRPRAGQGKPARKSALAPPAAGRSPTGPPSRCHAPRLSCHWTTCLPACLPA